MALRQSLLQEKQEHRFISFAALAKLINERSVGDSLLARNIQLQSSTVSTIVAKAPKLFAILVLLELEHRIPDLINKGTTDDVFPIRQVNFPGFEDDKKLQDVCREQWIIPPKLGDTTHLDLPRDARLPFTEKEFSNHGTFGILYKVKVADGHLSATSSTAVLALKTVATQDRDIWETVMREVDTLRKRRHSHIVPLLASFTQHAVESSYETKSLNMLFPYAEMDMEQWMNLKQPPTWLRNQSLADQRRYLYQTMHDLLSALAYLHREIDGTVTSHHDLKPRNILVFGETLKICDLGRSHIISLDLGSETEGRTGLGSYTYHPPEYWNDDGTRAAASHGRAFDVWAMGCIMIEVATLVVYGWESQEVKAFREHRINLPQTARRFRYPDNQERPDDSFHNNIPALDTWLSRLENDGSYTLKQTLTLATGMLREAPKERLYSWEAVLDMYEILNPDASADALFNEGTAHIQRPWPKDLPNGRSTPIHRASSRGNLNRVKILVQAGWQTNITDNAGARPINLAHRNGYHNVCHFLSRAFSPGSPCLYSLADGCCRDSTTVFSDFHVREGNGFRVKDRILDESRADSGNGLQCFNAGSGHHTATPLRQVHECGVSEGEKSQKIADSAPAAVSILEANRGAGRTVVHIAARDGDIEKMRLLLACNDASQAVQMTDDFWKTPLHYAAQFSSAEMVLMILQASSDPHSLVVSQDQNGRIPLHMAAISNQPDIASALVSFGRNKSLMIRTEDDNGENSLQLAARLEHYDLAELLRLKRIAAADVNSNVGAPS